MITLILDLYAEWRRCVRMHRLAQRRRDLPRWPLADLLGKPE